MHALLYPPVAFLIYVALVAILLGLGRLLAGPGRPAPRETGTYASGEAGPTTQAAPGYQQFFIVALFFAILHLGILMAGSGGLTPVNGVYLGGLALILVALILG